jgi:hypothetical protein
MKKITILLLLILPFHVINGQKNGTIDFNRFINKFVDFDFPIEPNHYFETLTAYQKIKYIGKFEFDKYLRITEDSFWKFNNNYEYCFGGKKKFDNYWLIFYTRNFMPEEYNKSIGETILETMTFDGKLISRILICGGYGDTKDYIFQAKIYSPDKIEINYTNYTDKKMIGNTNTYETKEVKSTKYYYIRKDGKIVLKQ